MKTQEHWFPGRLSVLTEGECLELLEQESVGRVAWNEPEGPVVLPLNYAMDGPAIVFRTSLNTKLAQQLHLGFASFQIDDHDDFTQSGWSVLVRGVLSCTESRQAEADEYKVVPWAAGERHFVLRITPLMISGRRIIPT